MSELLVNTIKKADGTGSLSVPAESGTVVTTASPSLGRRNRIINGDMRIDQRNSGAAVTDVSYRYMLDRFGSGYFGSSATGRTTVQQSTTAPTGFKNSLAVTVTTADTTLGGTAAYILALQSIEGFNISDLDWGTADAKTITISFWVRSSVTGNHPLIVANGYDTRAYGALYSISSADTWEYKTLTIAGDTSGTWATDNTSGLNIRFVGGGETVNREIGTGWGTITASKTAVTGGINLIETNGATWYITGVQLEVGSVATPFEHRSYGEELALCQRYYFNTDIDTGNSFASLIVNAGEYNSYQFKVRMRSTPTMTLSPAVGTLSNLSVSNSGFYVQGSSTSSMAIEADAEL